jgi:hypothetical protein
MASSNSTDILHLDPALRSFVQDTLIPIYGGFDPNRLFANNPQVQVGGNMGLWGFKGEFPFVEWLQGQYSPLSQTIKVDTVAARETGTGTHRVLTHEFAHHGANPRSKTSKMQVPRQAWYNIMTPIQRKDAIAKHGRRTFLEEDFAEENENAITFLRESLDYPTAKSLEHYMSAWLRDKRTSYLVSRFLTRQDSPFFNHPWKQTIIEKIKELRNG